METSNTAVPLSGLERFISNHPPHVFKEEPKTNNPAWFIFEELSEYFLQSKQSFGVYFCTNTTSGEKLTVYFVDQFAFSESELRNFKTRPTKFSSILFLPTDATLHITRTPDQAERIKNPYEE
jgi:hypothetical protein